MASATRRTLLFGLAVAPFAFARDARAQGLTQLTQQEVARIERGETVARPQILDFEGHRYVGGVTYTIVDLATDELIALMDNESAYGHVLPRAKFVKRIRVDGPDVYMEVHHGNALIDAAYTMHLKQEPEQSRIRFWIDLSRPHDVGDAWGFFRYQALSAATPSATPRLLLTYGALVDLGESILRSLYEEKVRVAMLSLPQRLRRYVGRTFHR